MPLYPERVAQALQTKINAFQFEEEAARAAMDELQTMLSQFGDMSRADVESAIADAATPVGARPTGEQDSQPLIVPFVHRWANHQESHDWARAQLEGTTTFAADGSQISPSKDLSIPVGLVQIGWYQNPHDPERPYVKDVRVDVLSPHDLTGDDRSFADREVEWRRFQGEVDAALNFMEGYAGQPALAFFDGSFIVSFTSTMQSERQRQYAGAIKMLLRCSEETQVPVVGFVDTSYSTDVATLLAHMFGYSGRVRISDAALLRPRMDWGDRSRLYICDRDDQVEDRSFYHDVCIAYLKTTRDNPPARVELPRWVYETGQHEWTFDMVRAECVVGVGYPYALETADAAAVLTMQDRERFYRMFQQFAEDQSLPLHFSRKSMSKRVRR